MRQQLQDVKAGPPDYSAYVTHTWKPAARIDHNVLHLLRKLSVSPTAVPASSLVFARSAGFADIKQEFERLADLCWPFHEAVIRELAVEVVVCFGKDATKYVRRRFSAHEAIDAFVERNDRRWPSTTYRVRGGLKVVGVTHPSWAGWRNPAADVSDLVIRALAQP